MSRLVLALGAALVVVALLAGAVAVLAYGADAQREGSLAVEGLERAVSLSWGPESGVTVEAETLSDLALGLGYAHAADHAWTMMLWRQAGRGALSEWFGAGSRGLDRHARTLGLGALAQRTYRALDDSTRSVLDAYARGVNAALAEPGVAQGDAFVLLDVEPEVWRPWDALVVERLLAYLSTPSPGADSTWRDAAARDSLLGTFLDADSTFRTALGVGGTDGARAFAAPAADGLAFVAHQPAGTSSLALLAPATLRLGGRSTAVATIPGTLAFPVGWTGDGGWSVFLTSALDVEPFAGPLPPLVHSRIVERDGDESLLTVPRDSSGLVLSARVGAIAAPADSVTADSLAGPSGAPQGLRLRWAGFRTGTDVPAFAALLAGAEAPAFRLLRGDGLRVRSGTATALGAPPALLSDGESLVAGASPDARRAAPVLSVLEARADTAGALTARSLAGSDASVWAAQTLVPLLRALGDRDSLDTVLDAPYAFLKGWDFRYAPDAIAPSIFEAWLESHEDYTGHAPDVRDSLDVRLLPYTLRIARATLRDRHGPDVIAWQWGRLQGGLEWPVVAERDDPVFARRFPTAVGGPGGHPTSLFPGPDPTRNAPAGQGPATWSAWATVGSPRLAVRTPLGRLADAARPRGEDVLTRFLLPDPDPERPRLRLLPPS